MKRLRAVAVVLALAAAAPADNSHALFAEIGQITSTLSQVTGFEVRRHVPYALIGRRELRAFLEQRIREQVKPEEIRIEEMLLKKFGLAPPDFDLKQTTIELYAEQAAAFYDFKRRKLFILESDDEALQRAALVHELAHALADQHFRLERFLDRAGANDDGALARLAVMEGQASYLMAELMARQAGQSLEKSPELVSLMSRMFSAAPGGGPVFDSAPLYIRESLIFPYTAGMRFQQAVVERMGREGFREVFRRPPQSTQEILHPERYFAAEPVAAVTVPALGTRRQYRTLAEGVVGEFDYAVLIRQYLGEESARRIAPAWRGARYALLEHRRERRTVLLTASRWSSGLAAEEFRQAYREVLAKKWKRLEVTGETPESWSGRGDDGFFLLHREGPYVYSFEGLGSLGEARPAGRAASGPFRVNSSKEERKQWP